jgi:hypothetical protein
MRFSRARFLLAALVLFLGALTAHAGTIGNWDPSLPAPAPVLNAGWASDQINAAGPPATSLDSPYIYNLAFPATFTITDDFIVGDVFTVWDFGNPILVAANWGAMPPFGGPGPDPFGWLNAGYAKGSVQLAAGPHSLDVTGNGAGGVPAGFWTRIDSAPVPEPSTLALLSVGLGALCFLRRRKSH